MASWLSEIRSAVNTRLETYLAEKHAEAQEISPASLELVDAIAALTMRGGKRLRAGILAAGYRAFSPDGDLKHTVDAAAAMELLQSYLLIHDDWMDGDEERRGGPSAHVALAQQHADAHLGASVAILAGDLASAYAWELFVHAPFPKARQQTSFQTFLTIHKEVFFGQHLDLVGSKDVPRVHRLKTGSYTVRGPLLLGALLADAPPERLDALGAFADPLGLAFQIRDDLLGTFGATEQTGKPAGNDIRAGKQTALMAEAERSLKQEEQALLFAAWGKRDASQDTIQRAIDVLIASGVKHKVEAQLDEQTEASLRALDALGLEGAGKTMLLETVALMTQRDH